MIRIKNNSTLTFIGSWHGRETWSKKKIKINLNIFMDFRFSFREIISQCFVQYFIKTRIIFHYYFTSTNSTSFIRNAEILAGVISNAIAVHHCYLLGNVMNEKKEMSNSMKQINRSNRALWFNEKLLFFPIFFPEEKRQKKKKCFLDEELFSHRPFELNGRFFPEDELKSWILNALAWKVKVLTSDICWTFTA